MVIVIDLKLNKSQSTPSTIQIAVLVSLERNMDGKKCTTCAHIFIKAHCDDIHIIVHVNCEYREKHRSRRFY